jgi:hypothetical protein
MQKKSGSDLIYSIITAQLETEGNHENHSQDTRCLRRDSNCTTPEYISQYSDGLQAEGPGFDSR